MSEIPTLDIPEKDVHVVSDADSTALTIESLDRLFTIVLDDSSNAPALNERFAHITEAGMSGNLAFEESISHRVELLADAKAHQGHVEQLKQEVPQYITATFMRCAPWIRRRLSQEKFHFFSGGFEDYLQEPLSDAFGAAPHQVRANKFVYDKQGYIIGYDKTRLLAQSHGKARLIKALREADDPHERIQGYVVMLGDGNNDRQAKADDGANEFWQYVGNLDPDKRRLEADATVYNFYDVVRRCYAMGGVALRNEQELTTHAA
jgi:D-3-phosphoglycerate dehydrogenase